MGNSQQISRRSSAPVECSHEQLIIHSKHISQSASSYVEDYELSGNADHTGRSVDDRVLKLQVADAEFSNIDSRSLPRRLSWPSADKVNRCFSANYFTGRQLPCTYVDRLLCGNRPSCREVQNAGPTCREDVTDIGLAGCDEGALNSDNTPRSAPRYMNTHRELTVCLPHEMGQDVMQNQGDESDPVDDLFVSTFSNDDDDSSNGDMLSEHSLDDDKQSVSDEVDDDISDDDDDDDDDVDHSMSDDWLTQDTDVNDDEDVVCSNYSLQMLTVTQSKSVASQTSLKLLVPGSMPAAHREVCNTATQTELDCSSIRAQHQQQPVASVSRLLEQRPAVDLHSRNSGWYNENRTNEEDGSNNSPYDLEQAAPPNILLWTPRRELVHTSERDGMMSNAAVYHGADGVLSTSLADQNDDDNHITFTVGSQQRHELKKSDGMTRKMTVGEASQLRSALADYDRLRVETKVRDTLEDRHQGLVTNMKDNSWYESVTPAADCSSELNALFASRNQHTWHVDFERNTRIWKLLVS